MSLFGYDVPIIAILRGVKTHEAIDICEALVYQGIKIIEVPLNSPAPFTTIERLVEHFGDNILLGAGTVLSKAEVGRLVETGAKLMVSPNFDPEVVREGIDRGLIVAPGVYSPSEAFAASKAGAKSIKLFPAGGLGVSYLRDLKAVLPKDLKTIAVGGVNQHNIKEWLESGASGIGAASSIYTPGDSANIVSKKAQALVSALK